MGVVTSVKPGTSTSLPNSAGTLVLPFTVTVKECVAEGGIPLSASQVYRPASPMEISSIRRVPLSKKTVEGGMRLLPPMSFEPPSCFFHAVVGMGDPVGMHSNTTRSPIFTRTFSLVRFQDGAAWTSSVAVTLSNPARFFAIQV